MKKIISFGAVFGFLPMLAFAAGTASFGSILNVIAQLLARIIPVLITLAVVYFIWGVIQYTVSTDEEAKKGARGKIINGLIGLFVIVAFWGIIELITNTFAVGPGVTPVLPCIPNAVEGITC